MTDVELSALEAAAKAATRGPWKCKNAHGILLKDEIHSENGALVAMALAKRHPLNGEQYVGYEQTESNAAFIAAANPAAVLDLIAELRQTRNERDWLAVNLANGLVDPGCIEHLAELGGMSPPDPATLIEAAKEAIK